MAKRQKLSLQQKRRVATKQKKQLKKAEHSEPVVDEQQLSDARSGIVISRFGEQVDVADDSQTIYRAYLRQNLGSCVSGDRVVFRVDNQNHGIVEAIEPRTSELSRPTPHSGIKTIVANVDQIFVVVAPYPDYSSLILDRYLIACELAGITTHIVFNKVDLFTDESQKLFAQQQAIYQDIGYRTFSVSCKQKQGLDQLYELMKNHENIFVGQSGVGKSTLINQIMPGVNAATGEVSENSRLGTHTTTASRLYFIAEGGHIIDSPGVREFGLSHIEPEQVLNGMIDLRQFDGQCKFRNCSHMKEKGCAISMAVEQQKINPQRFTNYQKIVSQIELANK